MDDRDAEFKPGDLVMPHAWITSGVPIYSESRGIVGLASCWYQTGNLKHGHASIVIAIVQERKDWAWRCLVLTSSGELGWCSESALAIGETW